MTKTFGETQCKTRKPSACIVLEQLQLDSSRVEQQIAVQSTPQLLYSKYSILLHHTQYTTLQFSTLKYNIIQYPSALHVRSKCALYDLPLPPRKTSGHSTLRNHLHQHKARLPSRTCADDNRVHLSFNDII